jgi:chitinase
LDDSCAASPHGSAKSAIKAWTGAGFPIHKIVLGVPSFGHSYHVDPSKAYDASGKLKPYVPFDKALQPSGDKWDAKGGGVDGCGNQILPGGIFQFWGMIENGFLDKNGNHAKGIDYVFDQCSQTVSDQ